MYTILQIIICFFLGSIFGNILTTFFFRIPRNLPINGIEQPPMCSSCRVTIKYPYYAPYFQAIFKGLKCSFCHSKIPFIYTLIELSAGIFCVIFFLIKSLESISILQFFAIIWFGLIFLLNYKTAKFFEKANWVFLTIALCFAHYKANVDFTEFIIFKSFFAIITGILLKIFADIKHEKLDILEICLLIVLALLLNSITFLFCSAFYLILKWFIKKWQLAPFLLAIILI